MEIIINNCNNIKEAKINIEENKLNIKYGLNGTGKSTIASAIENKNELSYLKSFGSNTEPTIKINKNIKKVISFNSNFIDNIVFNGSNVIENSFEVFIKSEKYDNKRKKIQEDLVSLNQETLNDETIKEFIGNINFIVSKLIITNKGNVKKTIHYKSILNTENIFKIPKLLEKYKDFLEDNNMNIEWIEWLTKGFKFDEKGICPFCTNIFDDNYNKRKSKFLNTYKKRETQNIVEMKNTIDKLKTYLKKSKYEILIESVKEPKSEDEISLVFKKFIEESNYIQKKIKSICNFDSFNISNEEISQLHELILKMIIDYKKLDFYGGIKFIKICKDINEKINNLLEKLDVLKKEIGEVNGLVLNTIKKSKKEINQFLEIAGFKYEFDFIVNNENEAVTFLKYKIDNEETTKIENIKRHLSWGEKNAFALILFMYYAISQKADLIILDDPISSFDDNKKYAIIDRLFINKKTLKSFRNKTVLMLTHDFEPIINFVVNNKPNNEAKVSFIKNYDGLIKEKYISQDEDIKLISHLYYKYAKDSNINIISRVSFLRKYIEITNNDQENMNLAYEILSSIIHGKKEISIKVNRDKFMTMTQNEKVIGINYIKDFIENFDYSEMLKKDYTQENIIKLYKKEHNNYLKSQLFREYLEISNKRKELQDNTLLKFVDEIFHIENDYIYSLDLIKFDTIPNFIIKRIDKYMDKERLNIESKITIQ